MSPTGLGRPGASTEVTGAGRRFATVGVFNTAVDFGLFALLGGAGVPVVAANMVSTSAGMTLSFFANRAWSFRSSRSVRESLLPFLAVTLVGLWVLHPLVIVTTLEVLRWWGLDGDPALWLGKGAAIAVGLVWNFVLYRHVVFSDGARRDRA